MHQGMKKRIAAAFLSGVMAVTFLSSSVLADTRLLRPKDDSETQEIAEPRDTETTTQSSGSITVKKLRSYARDYSVSDEFLDELSGKSSISKSAFKKYAVKYSLPAQYVQRFFNDAFVFKSGSGFEYIPVDRSVAQNNFDWDNLVKNSKETKYVVDGAVKSQKGIDISEFQGTINWKKVKADGVKFAFIRVGYRGYGTGKIVEDSQYRRNLKNASAAGIKVGVYFYSQAATVAEAKAEARFVLDAIEGYDIDYPVVFDMEGPPNASARTSRLTKSRATEIAEAFCNTVKSAGYRPMIYTYTKWLAEKLDMSRLDRYDFWLAQYYEVPFYPYAVDIFQYSATGRVNGIKGNVDMNMGFTRY